MCMLRYWAWAWAHFRAAPCAPRSCRTKKLTIQPVPVSALFNPQRSDGSWTKIDLVQEVKLGKDAHRVARALPVDDPEHAHIVHCEAVQGDVRALVHHDCMRALSSQLHQHRRVTTISCKQTQLLWQNSLSVLNTPVMSLSAR